MTAREYVEQCAPMLHDDLSVDPYGNPVDIITCRAWAIPLQKSYITYYEINGRKYNPDAEVNNEEEV